MTLKEQIDSFTKSERLEDFVDRIMLLPLRLKHRHKSRRSHKIRRQTIRSVQNLLKMANEIEAKNFEYIFNVGLYVLLYDQDIAFFNDEIVLAVGRRKRIFIAKNEAVLLYEASEDLRQLLGKKFRDALNVIEASEEKIADLNSISSNLNQFWQANREFLKSVRNILAAHREHDSVKYIEKLEALEPLEIMKRASEFSQILERVAFLIIDLTKLTFDSRLIIKDITLSNKK